MDRTRQTAKNLGLMALLAALAVLQPTGEAAAQRPSRMVYNPVTRQTEPELQPQQASRQLAWQSPAVRQAAAVHQPIAQQAAAVREAAVEEVQYEAEAQYVEPQGHHDGCGCADCAVMGCGDLICETPACGGAVGCPCPPAKLYVGFEFTFVKPRFEKNVAFTSFTTNGTGADVFADTEFDYDLVLTPRVFLGWEHADGVGLRATWWQFDNAADQATISPAANGLGMITHPTFTDINLSSTDPDDIFRASSHLNAYAIDLEATKATSFCGWDLGVAGGVRYAYAEQGYDAEVETANTAAASGREIDGTISYVQSIEGIGPTISLSASRPLTCRSSLFCKARGSLLFGDGESRLSGQEEALDAGGFQFTTDRSTNRDDVMSIAEMQLGFRWQGGEPCYTFRPFLTMAMEGQVWNGAGSAVSEDGTLGFFGFASQLGLEW